MLKYLPVHTCIYQQMLGSQNHMLGWQRTFQRSNGMMHSSGFCDVIPHFLYKAKMFNRLARLVTFSRYC